MNTTTNSSISLAAFLPFLLVVLGIFVIYIAGLWKVFTKAGQPGWAAIVPIYNTVVMLQIGGLPTWYLAPMYLGGFIPVVGILVAGVFGILMLVGLGRAFGKSTGFIVGLCLASPIFLCILGFGSSEYLGGGNGRALGMPGMPGPSAWPGQQEPYPTNPGQYPAPGSAAPQGSWGAQPAQPAQPAWGAPAAESGVADATSWGSVPGAPQAPTNQPPAAGGGWDTTPLPSQMPAATSSWDVAPVATPATAWPEPSPAPSAWDVAPVAPAAPASPPPPPAPVVPAPGWYPVDGDQTHQAWWDGTTWSNHQRWDGAAWQSI